MSFRFTVSLFEADRDAGSPDAADITAILRKSEREPVVLSLSDDGHESVRHLLELRIGDRPEPMSVEVNVPQWLHFILPFVGLVAWLALSNLARRRDTPNHKEA